jgi:hypothetical protein
MMLNMNEAYLTQSPYVTIVLILVDSSGDMIGEVLIEHFVDGRCAGCCGVK